MFRRLFPLLIVLLITPFTLTAQEDAHPPQFLYRDGDQLVLISLVEGGTSATSALPNITAQRGDRFVWSPNGDYLAGILLVTESFTGCLNLYSMGELDWVYTEPIACGVEEFIFTPDASQLIYSVRHETSGEWRIFTLSTRHDEALYATEPTESQTTSTYVCCANWSPSGKYFYFEDRFQIMGGSNNYLVMMDFTTRETYALSAPNAYYANYSPIWSTDEEWYLLTLQEEYVTSGALAQTNHMGDVYLIQASDGETYRITYTPAEAEIDVHWTDDGTIAFRNHVSYYVDHDFSVEEALAMPEADPATIITPEPVDPATFFQVSPPEYPEDGLDWGLSADLVWQNATSSYRLEIAYYWGPPSYSIDVAGIYFETTLEESERWGIVGWRPCPCSLFNIG